MNLGRTVLAIAACAALSAPTAAIAGQPRLLGNANNSTPTVTAGVDGNFHAAFNDPDGNLIVYCQVTPATLAGGQPCARRTVLPFNDADGGSTGAPGTPWVLADEPGVLRIGLAQYVSGKSYVWTSTDGGATFTGPVQIGAPRHGAGSGRPVLFPAAGTVAFPTANPASYVAESPLNGSAAMSEARADLDQGGDDGLIYNLSLGITPEATVATADDLTGVFAWRLPNGAGVNDSAAWGTPVHVAAETDSSMHGRGRPWVAYTAGTPGKQRLEMRGWNGDGFGPPTVVERTAGYLADVYVSEHGVPGVAYRRNGSGLRFAHLRPGAKRFTVKTVVASSEVFHDLVVAHDDAARGVAVWRRDGAVMIANLTEVRDRTEPRVSVTRTVRGFTLGLNVPGGCVVRGRPFGVTTSGQGNSRIMKVRYRVGARTTTDSSRPWGATVVAPASAGPGAVVRVTSRVSVVRTGTGAATTRVLSADVRVCGG